MSQLDSRLKLSEWADPLWRLSNLYFITDKAGSVVKFTPNREQQEFLEGLHHRNCILKARQLGFSTLIQLMELDAAVFTSNVRAGIIADSLDKASVIFRDKIKFAYDRLPEGIRALRAPLTDSATELLLSNNSSVRVGTSMRSGTLQYLHISEFGKICAKNPEQAREIMTGAIPAVAPDGFLFVESTAEGREGPFFDMVERSRKRADTHHLPIEEKFFFFPWWNRSEYEADPERVVLSEKDRTYFADLQKKLGFALSARKQAWYVAMRATQGDDMKREYPSTPEEAFESSNEGAWYREQMDAIRYEKRICNVPYQRGVPVNTFWDLGANDTTAIWFHQIVGPEHRFLRFYEANGKPIDHFVEYMGKTGYVFGKHYLPHDGDHKRLGAGFANRSIKQMMEDLSVRGIEIVPRIPDVVQGINQTRMALSSAYFDAEGCKEGVDHLDHYSKTWSRTLGCWTDEPRHDIHSNGADALRQWGQHLKAITHTPQWGALNYPNLAIA